MLLAAFLLPAIPLIAVAWSGVNAFGPLLAMYLPARLVSAGFRLF